MRRVLQVFSTYKELARFAAMREWATYDHQQNTGVAPDGSHVTLRVVYTDHDLNALRGCRFDELLGFVSVEHDHWIRLNCMM
jgi:hypothetical protein